MSYLSELVGARHSKGQVEKIVRHIEKDQKRFDELLNITLGKDPVLAQYASWSLGYCVESHPELAKKHLRRIIDQLSKPAHPAIGRNLAKLLIFVDIPEKFETGLIENCFHIVNSLDEPIANRAYAAYTIEKICKKYPELYQELISCLQAHSEVASPGMKAVIRKILKGRDKVIASESKKRFII